MVKQLLTELLSIVLPRASQFVRDQLVQFVEDIEDGAKATENAWDDDLVDALKEVLGISDA